MKHVRLINGCICSIAFFLILAAPLRAESMGVSAGYDLDKLWSRAEKHFDLSKHDAVLLLERSRVTIADGGGQRTLIHRVVWIGTERGIDDHADLRIPYNSETSAMKVVALRTRRDGRWWPDETEIGPTAVVETLPFAAASAADYTAMRETMLLHDGVELPCIMETIYEIDEYAAGGGGSDGLWIFSQRDPAVLVEYILDVPGGATPIFRSGNGAPEPEVKNGAGGMTSYTWRMENVERLGSPRIADPAVYAPYVAWSTWKDWQALGRAIVSSFDEAAVLGVALADTLAGRLEYEPSQASKARSVAGLVNEFTRSIHYDSGFWFLMPRPAPRTFETAYGHALDRAVLASAMFRNAGLSAEPVFRSVGPGRIDRDIPGLSRFGEIAVLVKGDRLEALYDPSHGTLNEGMRPLYGRIVWRPSAGEIPSAYPAPGVAGDASRFELNLTLEPAEEGWSGTGFLEADGLFCPYGYMTGLEDEALGRIGSMAATVLEGADVTGFNPEVFERTLVSAGFGLDAKKQKPDEQGRMRFVIGDPEGGITANLPPDVHLYHEHRLSPVILPGTMTQRIRLRLKTGNSELVYLPETRTVENKIGRYTLTVMKEDGWVTVDRELMLEATRIDPEAWPALRALLLEELDPAGRTIILDKEERINN